jgi:HD superfamily phosphohydrolase YqeK
MMIVEYKKTIVHDLEKAVDEKEVEQIINRSIEQFPEEDLYRYLVVI